MNGFFEGARGVAVCIPNVDSTVKSAFLLMACATFMEGVYRANRRSVFGKPEAEQNRHVLKSIAVGLQHSYVYDAKTPKYVLRWLKEIFNSYGGGTYTFLEYLRELKRCNEWWLMYAESEHIMSRNCGQGDHSWSNQRFKYIVDVLKIKKFEGPTFFDDGLAFLNALHKYQIYDQFFLVMKNEAKANDPALNPHHLVSNFHAIGVAIARFEKTLTGWEASMAFMECLRLCVIRFAGGTWWTQALYGFCPDTIDLLCTKMGVSAALGGEKAQTHRLLPPFLFPLTFSAFAPGATSNPHLNCFFVFVVISAEAKPKAKAKAKAKTKAKGKGKSPSKSPAKSEASFTDVENDTSKEASLSSA